MQTDPIADFLTRIRNAAAAKHQRVDVPVSKLKTEIARILKEEGYIATFKLVDENKTRKMLRVFLKYTPDRRSVITGVKRISRPGARCYLGATDIRPVVGGLGISGDGVDQDDYVTSGGSVGFEAPTAIRADQIFINGVRLPYFKFPRNPTF